jgi:hypothetical protein
MLVFVHIPKTAGTTLHKVISHQYRRDRILIHHDADGPLAAAIPPGAAKMPEVVMGHLSVGLHRYHPGVRYVTCLREPVARLVSHYHHARNDPAHYLHEAIRKDNLDLPGYVASGLSGELSNGMTRMLAGVEDFHQSVIGPEALAQAKGHVEEHFDAVILSERFDEGLLLLAAKLGWSIPYYLRRKVGRYSAGATKPDAAARRVVEEYNALDLELYAWARERFESLATARPSLAGELTRFQRANPLWGKVVFTARELRSRLIPAR